METALFSDWLRMKRHRALPFAGGFADQAPAFVDASDVLDAEVARASSAPLVDDGG